MGSRRSGLTHEEAYARLAADGLNRFTPAPPVRALTILASQFAGVVTWLLLGAMAVSLAMGDGLDAVAIALVLALNALLGFALELRARRTMEALLGLVATRALVVRGDVVISIDASDVVRGDIIVLVPGRTVAADARLIQADDLRTDEAALTGESLPVEKIADGDLPEGEAPLADRLTMVYAGTLVISGAGRAVVVATGDRTEVGQIGRLTSAMGDGPTPLERRLDALGRRLAVLVLLIAAMVGALGIFNGEPRFLMIQTAIALAVAAVPEGLPAVATIALAIGLRRMARRRALVRKLSAVESLGSVTVVCTDKTRTLTAGDMVVSRVWSRDRESRIGDATSDWQRDAGVTRTLRAAMLAGQPRAGALPGGPGTTSLDPVEAAIFRAVAAAGVARRSAPTPAPDAVIPFSSERKYSAASFIEDGSFVSYAKGAPVTILDMCEAVDTDGGVRPLSPTDRDDALQANDRLASRGFRLLAVATGTTARSASRLEGLTFLGLIAITDPPAPGVRDAVNQLHAAGLRIVMLTGDQHRTAEAIGRELGIVRDADLLVDSRHWAAMPAPQRADTLRRAAVFSRITAADKLAIVSGLQQQGEIVAMLGDGINDAPALRSADVGVAMGGRGTDVARAAAAVVLQDDRFETIVAAVAQGRVIADNIRKVVFYLFSCNLAEVMVLLIATIAGLHLPLLPLQILWLNLVTDTFPALALALEPGDADVMSRPPRDSHEAILSAPFLERVLLYSALIVAGVMLVQFWTRDQPQAQTMVFMTLAFSQVLHLGNARSDKHVFTVRRALSNPAALGAVILSVVCQVLPLLVAPLGSVLQVQALSAQQWGIVFIGASVPALVGQGLKRWPGDAISRFASSDRARA